MIIALPIYLQLVLEYNAMQAGLSLAPLSLDMFGTALLAGKRARRRLSSRPAAPSGGGHAPTLRDAIVRAPAGGVPRRPGARSAVEHGPADLVPQSLVVEDELADRLRELITLPPALGSPRGLALALRRGRPYGLDRVRRRAELVRGDVRHDPRLPRGVSGVPRCATQVSRRVHGPATRGASLHHLDLATHPGAGLLDRLTRSRVLGLRRLEQGKHVLGARCRPERQETVIRVGERPTAADCHETRVSDFREDHRLTFSHLPASSTTGRRARRQECASQARRWGGAYNGRRRGRPGTPTRRGALLDDFSTLEIRKGATPDVLARLRRALPASLQLWAVIYSMSLDLPDLPDYLQHLDGISLWVWHGRDLGRLEEHVERCHALSGRKPLNLGLYFYNFGERRPLTVEQMAGQVDHGLRLVRSGEGQGLCFLSSSVMDEGLEAVEWTRRWIADRGDEAL
jgi:hypothetical protein